MIVFCNGMIRAGSTLQYNLVRGLIEKSHLGEGVGYFTVDQLNAMEREVEEWKNSQKLYIIKSHQLLPGVLELVEQNVARICYSFRDVRQVATSAIYKWGWDFDTLVDSLDDAIKTFDELSLVQRGVLTQRYENIVSNVENEVRHIVSFLNITVSDQVIDEVINENSLEAVLKKTAMVDPSATSPKASLRHTWSLFRGVLGKIGGGGVDPGEPVKNRRHANRYDARTLLHSNHVTDLSTEQRNLLITHEQFQFIDDRYSDWLQAQGYK